jgi:hypothetical protein
LRSPIQEAATWRVARHRAIQIQRLRVFFRTNDQSSSNSKTVAAGSCGSGSTSVVCNSGNVRNFF